MNSHVKYDRGPDQPKLSISNKWGPHVYTLVALKRHVMKFTVSKFNSRALLLHFILYSTLYTGGHNYVRVIIVSFNLLLNDGTEFGCSVQFLKLP